MRLRNIPRLILGLFLINRTFGNYDQTMSIKFSPRPGQVYAFTQPFSQAKVASADLSLGYGVCLRANIWTWNTNILLDSGLFKLRLSPYPLNQGTFTHSRLSFPFSHEKSLNYTKTAWNAFCASYNATDADDLTFSLMINGQLVLDFSSADLMLTETAVANMTLQVGGGYFTGQIADVQFWSRSLSYKEMLAYSEGCDDGFVANSGPAKMSWPVFNTTYYVGNYTQLSWVPKNGFCIRNKSWNQGASIFLIRAFDALYAGSKLCGQLNGEVVYPRDEDHLQNILSVVNATHLRDKCYNRFWVPATRSGWVKLLEV